MTVEDPPTPTTTGVDSYGNPTAVVAGELIESSWGNSVAGRVVHTFPDTATMNAWAGPVGTISIVTATGIMYKRVTGGWARQTPLRVTAAGTGGTIAASTPISSISVPTDPGARIGVVTVHISCVIGAAVTVLNLEQNGVVVSSWQYPASTTNSMCNMTAHVPMAANAVHGFLVYADKQVVTVASGAYNALSATVYPTG